MSDETYAVLMLGSLPERLFDDMDAAKEFVEDHDRIDFEDASIFWPVRPHDGGGD